MNVGKIVLLALLAIVPVTFMKAEPDGYEKYNAYQLVTYVDNLKAGIASGIISGSYYSKLTSKDYSGSQLIDTVGKRREVRIVTKKARGGYLSVNEFVTNAIDKEGVEVISIKYFVDGNLVSTDKEIGRLLRLRKRDVDFPRLSVRIENGTANVYIYSKGKH